MINEEDCVAATDVKKVKVANDVKRNGFAVFGLSTNILRGVQKLGFKQPTPIQRKAIPPLLQGRDVVGMACTGSGKTAAFLLPIFHHLMRRSEQGIRALIVSPTRELASQTFSVAKQLGRSTGIRSAVMVGGDALSRHFSLLHLQNKEPDILVATPGRLLHILEEMKRRLDQVSVVVFDEADRLFEMGFEEQLHGLLHRLPSKRQTVLMSATLPSQLTEFTRVGLKNPLLIRLDTEQKISDKLNSLFFFTNQHLKMSLLIYLITKKLSINDTKTLVFLPTHHHVELLKMILGSSFDTSVAYAYSSLDQEERRKQASMFRCGSRRIFLVTDVAARGLDIRGLDVVINYNFPAKPKLFVHRVGRVARGGKQGSAFTLMTKSDLALWVELQLFLGNPIDLSSDTSVSGSIGTVDRNCLANVEASISSILRNDHDINSMYEVAERSMKQYTRTCAAPSSESIRRSKNIDIDSLHPHPFFQVENKSVEIEDFVSKLKTFKPKNTIFEAMAERNNKKKKSLVPTSLKQPQSKVMKNKSSFDSIAKAHKTQSSEYLAYKPDNSYYEQGLNLNSFQKDIQKSSFNLLGDDDESLQKKQHQKHWDRRRKRMVGGPMPENGKRRKIVNESGKQVNGKDVNLYKEWLKKTKNTNPFESKAQVSGKKRKNSKNISTGLKHKEQIIKQKRRKQQKVQFQDERRKLRLKRQSLSNKKRK